MLIIFQYLNKKPKKNKSWIVIVFQPSTSFTFNPSFLLHVHTWTSILMYKKSEVLVRMRVGPTNPICGFLQVSTISKIQGKLIFALSSINITYNEKSNKCHHMGQSELIIYLYWSFLKSIVSSTNTQVQTQFQVIQSLSFIQIIIHKPLYGWRWNCSK